MGKTLGKFRRPEQFALDRSLDGIIRVARGDGAPVDPELENREYFFSLLPPRPSPEHFPKPIDPSKGIVKGNIHWAVKTFVPKSPLATWAGETKTLYEWSRDERSVVSYHKLAARLRCLWDFEKALTTP